MLAPPFLTILGGGGGRCVYVYVRQRSPQKKNPHPTLRSALKRWGQTKACQQHMTGCWYHLQKHPPPPFDTFARKELLLPKSRCPQQTSLPSVSIRTCLLTALRTRLHAHPAHHRWSSRPPSPPFPPSPAHRFVNELIVFDSSLSTHSLFLALSEHCLL